MVKRKEALLSSEIEGTQATLVDVFSFEHAEQVGTSSVDDLEEVANYVGAMNYALDEMRSKRGLVSLRRRSRWRTCSPVWSALFIRKTVSRHCFA
jgi:Fic family protein